MVQLKNLETQSKQILNKELEFVLASYSTVICLWKSLAILIILYGYITSCAQELLNSHENHFERRKPIAIAEVRLGNVIEDMEF